MKLDEFMKCVRDLPAISPVACEINAAIKDETLTAKALATIISRDPCLTAATLKLANSPFYGMAREISGIDRAITILGFEAVKTLALAISVSKVFHNRDSQLFDLNGLWRHSLGVALAARRLALSSPLSAGDSIMPEQAFICGILHDIGKIALILNFPEEMAGILAQTRIGDIAQYELEKNALGFNHQQAGQAMAEAWNFPEIYQTVIRFHHDHSAATASDGDKKIPSLISITYLGNMIAKSLGLGESTDPHQAQASEGDLSATGLNRQEMLTLMPAIRKEYEDNAFWLGKNRN